LIRRNRTLRRTREGVIVSRPSLSTTAPALRRNGIDRLRVLAIKLLFVDQVARVFNPGLLVFTLRACLAYWAGLLIAVRECERDRSEA
jgi:hypothetical protein